MNLKITLKLVFYIAYGNKMKRTVCFIVKKMLSGLGTGELNNEEDNDIIAIV